MKITNSSIAMASTHHETSFTYKESMTIEAAKSKDVAGAILTLSAEGTGKNLKESMVGYKKQQEEEAKQRRQEKEARSLQQMAEQMKTQKTDNQFEISDEYDMKIKMLRQIPARMVPRLILACAFAAMLLIDILALRISSIALLLIAAAVSLVLFTISQNIEREGSQ